MAIVFPDESCEQTFNTVLKSYGQSRGPTIDKIVKSMIRLFVNGFLTKNCLSCFSETNVNRLLVNYNPDASKLVEDLSYCVVQQFKNIYWSDAQLLKWRIFERMMIIYRKDVPLRVVSFADLTLVVIFMAAFGMMRGQFASRAFCSAIRFTCGRSSAAIGSRKASPSETYST